MVCQHYPLAVCVIYIVHLEYQKLFMFDMTAFDEGPRCHVTLVFGIQTKKILLEYLKQAIFQ
jgi:hypothetical protein